MYKCYAEIQFLCAKPWDFGTLTFKASVSTFWQKIRTNIYYHLCSTDIVFKKKTNKTVFRLYHKSAADDDYHVVITSVTSHMIEGLNPNTQYIVYVTAISEKGQSLPSETLIAWTDPAYPAFVEVRFKLIYLFNHFYLSSLWLYQ